MIHVELSVFPHHREVPPHTIIHRTFNTWESTRQFLTLLDLKADWKTTLDNPHNEYAQVELEVMEITGKSYTKAILAIEGHEERQEPDITATEHIKYQIGEIPGPAKLANVIAILLDMLAKDIIIPEEPPFVHPSAMKAHAKDLRHLADLWDRG